MPNHIKLASDPSRQHVTRGQMERLEAGQRVTVNRSQLDELQQFKPEFVSIEIHESRPLLNSYVVSIENTETHQTIPLGTRDKLGITLNPDGTIVRTSKGK